VAVGTGGARQDACAERRHGQTEREYVLSEVLVTGLVTLGLVAVWLVLGVLRAIRQALAERAANWLLPPSQPVTFRAGQFVALLARELAPRRRLIYAPWDSLVTFPEDDRLEGGLFFPGVLEAWDWPVPASALAELDSDLRAEQRIIAPVRLTAPLLRQAAGMHRQNGGELARCLRWYFAAIALYMVFVAVFGCGFIVYQAVESSRKLLHSLPRAQP
jgi:hypothetical protein